MSPVINAHNLSRGPKALPNHFACLSEPLCRKNNRWDDARSSHRESKSQLVGVLLLSLWSTCCLVHTHTCVFLLVFALCHSSLGSSPCNYSERTDGGQRRILTVNFPCFYFDRTAEDVAERGWWHSAKGMTLSQGAGETQFLPSVIPGCDWWRTRFHVSIMIPNDKESRIHCSSSLWGADTLLPQLSHLVDCTF